MPERIIDLYERHARAWDRARHASGLEDAWIDQFATGLSGASDLLDLGCGNGVPVAEALLASGHRVTGVDAAPSLIAMAARRFPGAVWIVGDMRALALRRTFDGIVAWASLFHLSADDQRAMFPRIAAHAHAGTRFLFTTGPREGIVYGEWQGEPLFHASLAPEEYRRLLDENGFTVLAHQIDDRNAGGATVWLARLDRQIRPASGLDGSA